MLEEASLANLILSKIAKAKHNTMKKHKAPSSNFSSKFFTGVFPLKILSTDWLSQKIVVPYCGGELIIGSVRSKWTGILDS